MSRVRARSRMSRRSLEIRRRMCWRSTSIFVSPGPARADAASEARHGLAPAAEPRQQVVQLRELHLRLALAGARVQREDVQDQRGPVDHLDPQPLLERAELPGRELLDRRSRRPRGSRGSRRGARRACPCRRTCPGSGSARLWTIRATGSAPAESASAASSSRSSSAIPRPTPTSTARSRTAGRQVAESGDSSTSRSSVRVGFASPAAITPPPPPAARTRAGRRSARASTRCRRRGTR